MSEYERIWQQEVDELRAENERLRAAPHQALTNTRAVLGDSDVLRVFEIELRRALEGK